MISTKEHPTLVEIDYDGHRYLSLSVSEDHTAHAHNMFSPYFRLPDVESQRKVGTGRDNHSTISLMSKAKITSTGALGPGGLEADYDLFDGSNALIGQSYVLVNLSALGSSSDIMAAVANAIVADALTNLSTTLVATDVMGPTLFPADVNALIAAALPVAPSSYQTIVSQTGTAAPAVSGSLAPVSTYPTGTTFTWARTGAGVYTLTASTAVFNTSKTGVFVGGLNNLNAQWKAVVTSTTVITFTFAVQSLAVLGLLGFTATNTDALLTGTMIYVQTYA